MIQLDIFDFVLNYIQYDNRENDSMIFTFELNIYRLFLEYVILIFTQRNNVFIVRETCPILKPHPQHYVSEPRP